MPDGTGPVGSQPLAWSSSRTSLLNARLRMGYCLPRRRSWCCRSSPIMPSILTGVLNPRVIWTLVVVVAFINAGGYVALRTLGPARGLALSGFAGGFVSSTATIGVMGALQQGGACSQRRGDRGRGPVLGCHHRGARDRDLRDQSEAPRSVVAGVAGRRSGRALYMVRPTRFAQSRQRKRKIFLRAGIPSCASRSSLRSR